MTSVAGRLLRLLGWPCHPPPAEAFTRIVQGRRSATRFDPTLKVPNPVLEEVLRNTLRTPSSFNLQPWKCIVVRDARVLKRLAHCMLGRNIETVSSAPVTAVFLADQEPWRVLQGEEDAPRGFRGTGNERFVVPGCTALPWVYGALSHVTQVPSINSPQAWGFKNASLAAQTYMLGSWGVGVP